MEIQEKILSYKVLSIGLFLIGVILIALPFIPIKSGDFEFTVKPDRPMPFYTCEAKKFYTVETSGRIKNIWVENKNFQIKTNVNRCNLYFEDNTKVKIDFELSGIWNYSGDIKISAKWNEKYPYLVYLKTDSYSSFERPVMQGMPNLEIKGQQEGYYIGQFKEKKLERESFTKKGVIIRFYRDPKVKKEILKFKAATVPFLFFLDSFPYMKE